MLNLLKPFWLSILKWGAIVGGVFLLLFKVRQSGKDQIRVDNLKQTLKGMQTRDTVDNTIARTSDDKLAKLREKWTRD